MKMEVVLHTRPFPSYHSAESTEYPRIHSWNVPEVSSDDLPPVYIRG